MLTMSPLNSGMRCTTANSPGKKYLNRSLVNSPSVDYNILSLSKPLISSSSFKSLRGTDEKICFKKKAIAELADLGRLYNPNFHANYKVVYSEAGILHE
jgi:hypothetical protein